MQMYVREKKKNQLPVICNKIQAIPIVSLFSCKLFDILILK